MRYNLGYFRKYGFSLIELIVVISIIAIIAAFTVPAATTILRGSKLTQASQMVTDQISLARQQALTRNRTVEVRFIRFGDAETPGEDAAKPSTGNFRALQVFQILENGIAVPLDKVQMLPIGVLMDPLPTFSSLIAGAGQKITTPDTTAPELPRGVGKKYDYVSFRFQQDGSTNLTPTGNWFVTLHNSNDQATGNTPPANFFTLQIDPVSGSSKSYRPTAG